MWFVFLFSLQLLSETFLILRRNERGMIKDVYWYSCVVPDILVRFLRHLNFLDRFPKKFSTSIKIRPVGTEVFHADGRTDRHDKGNSNFHSFTNATKTLSRRLVHWALVANRVPPKHNLYGGLSCLPSKYMLNATIRIDSKSILYTGNCVWSLFSVTQDEVRRECEKNIHR
jgi:hypothetical protein